MESYDVLVVGGGIAGASAGYALARRGAHVLLAETEQVLAHHTTGRSAAMFLESYGSEQTRRLCVASRAGFVEPPGLDRSLLSPRGFLVVGDRAHEGEVTEWARRAQELVGSVELLEGGAVLEICPALKPDHACCAVWEPGAADIDVAGLHQAYVSALRRLGGQTRVSAPVRELVRVGPAWRCLVGSEHVLAERVLNAAGAWGDEVAALAQVPPVGLLPKRRTAFTAATPEAWDRPEVRSWPMIQDIAEQWYLKPEGDALLCSLSEETPSEPCDAKVDEMDVALAIDNINEATTLSLRRVRASWAGLRTFASDRDLVLGTDPVEPTFSWYVGLGGYGIQTAPAAGELVAALALGEAPPAEVQAAGVSPERLSPSRFRTAEQDPATSG